MHPPADPLMTIVFAVVIVVPTVTVAAVMIAVPTVVVGKVAALAVPIAIEPAAALIAGSDPDSAAIGGAGPIAGVPAPAVASGIPIAVHPDEIRSGRQRAGVDARRRRRSNLNSNRDLAEECACGHKQHRNEKFLHVQRM